MKFTISTLLLICNFLSFGQKQDTSTLIKSKVLSNISIVRKKPFIENRVDKIIMNVQSDLTSSGSSAFEMLQKAPGISIINQETISMSGKSGVNVLIDGRPTFLSEKDLALLLKSSPAIGIDKIELITNPSSKYDASGNAGIINIIMKKNTLQTLNGNISASYSQSVHPSSNLSANFYQKIKSIVYFFNASGRNSHQWTHGSINRYVTDNQIIKNFLNTTVDKDAARSGNIIGGVDYNINKKNSLGVLVKSSNYTSDLFTPGQTLIKKNGKVDSSLSTTVDNGQQTHSNNFNTHYNFQDTLGFHFNIDLDYTSYKNISTGAVHTNFLNNTNTVYNNQNLDQVTDLNINIYGLKLDFEKELKNIHAKVEFGLKLNKVETNNNLIASIDKNGISIADTGRTNKFNYTEKINAAYTNYSQHLNKWEYQLGLRLEQIKLDGTSKDLKNTTIPYPDSSYVNLFLTAFLKYTINQNNTIGLSFGSRIQRPNYQDLNPFEFVYDVYTKEKGNPYLLPQRTSNIEINYSYKGSVNVSLGSSQTNNYFQTVSIQNGDLTNAIKLNIGTEYRQYLNLSGSYSITKNWNGYLNLSPFYRYYNGKILNQLISNKSFGMSWYANQTFSLPKKLKLQISSWGNAATTDATDHTAWLGSLDFGAGKDFFHDKLNVRLAVIDILNTQRWLQHTNFSNVDFIYQRKWESRNLSVQLNWKFGKSKSYRQDRSFGNEEEINRIKS